MIEKEIQNNLINVLSSYGWKYIESLKTKKQIIDNFKISVEKRNSSKLNKLGIKNLSEKEFSRLMKKINSKHSFSEYQETFLDDNQEIKTDNGDSIYLDLFDKTDYYKNVYEIADEVIFDEENKKRMDVLLLINGIPILNIELKREEAELGIAINQLEVYSKKYTSIFKFIQILVASNNKDTVYFANSEKINKKFIFNYSNNENKNIKELTEFAREFLNSKILFRYITNFIINIREKKLLLSLRGYQVHGVESIINKLKKPKGNGYLWHATGSGKTITSFKAAEIIAKEIPEYKKVIFLVDRKELDSQTIKEYNLFLPSYKKLPDTSKTSKLAKSLVSNGNKLIVSTIHKMSKFINEQKYKNDLNNIKDEKLVFVFDEGHRSQAGDMNESIRNAFKNSRFIGFTGTPIFQSEIDENKIRITTNDIFDENLHSYLIQNAINDKNVLPFNVTYNNDDEKVLKTKDFLTSKMFIKNVSKDILKTIDQKTHGKQFVAMLVANNIDSALGFYEELKKEQNLKQSVNESYKKLNIAITFSMSQNYQDSSIQRKKRMQIAIDDFNFYSNSRETIENNKEINKYQNRLQFLIKENDFMPKVNLVIVVDRLLTGFDAKRINTLYIAKEMRMHSLIQAFSRTNRIFDEQKVQGEIISYVPGMKEKTDEAIKVYGNLKNASNIFRKEMNYYLDSAKKLLDIINAINPHDIIKKPFENIEEGKKYIQNVDKLNETIKVLKTMDNFEEMKLFPKGKVELDQMINNTYQIRESSRTQHSIKKNEINIYDEISIPIRAVAIDSIDSQYIKEKILFALSEQNKGNDLKMNEHFEELILKLESVNHVLLEKVKKIKKEIEKNPDFNYISYFENEIFTIEKELKVSFEIDKYEIEKELDNYKFYGNYDTINKFKNKLKQIERIKKLGFVERNNIINESINTIKDKVDSIRITKEIVRPE
ncbi:MAG: HsdR family type I site-specific deoxyribonuclease [Mollicutes bacterium PWAP]|nr:HsdR family type I site-specific deoxyribonuclease [Mollicutes bacterium PWAP]